MSNGLEQVINYMIPAVGTPRGYFWSGVLSATPVTIDFRNVSGGGIDGQPFRPSGVFIDNTQGTGSVTITVNEIAYQMTCLAGELLNLQFPAPVDISVSFVGLGQATIVFVDFPVLPYRNTASSGMVNPMTTLGDIIRAAVGGTPERLAVGTDGDVLTVVAGEPEWSAPTVYMTNPMTTAEDLIVGGTAGAPGRLPAGTDGFVLTMVAGAVAWAAASGGMTNPLTTTGDVIYSSSGSTPARLGIGSTNDVLTVVGGVPVWAAPTGGMTNPLTTTGDIIYSSSGTTPARLGAGSTGDVLTIAGGVPTWAAPGALSQTGTPSYLASGDIYPINGVYGTMAAGALTATNRSHFSLMELTGPLTFTDIVLAVTAGSAATTMDIGIYEFLGAGKPGVCLASANISTASTGVASTTLGSPVALTPGLYFVLWHGTSVTPTVSSINDTTKALDSSHSLLLISNGFTRIAAGTTTLSSTLLLDSALPGGSYTIGMDLTGLDMTSASIVGYNTRIPVVGLTKQ